MCCLIVRFYHDKKHGTFIITKDKHETSSCLKVLLIIFKIIQIENKQLKNYQMYDISS